MTFLHRLLRPRQPRLEDLYAARKLVEKNEQKPNENGKNQ